MTAFTELTIIFIFAFIVALIFRLLKQPLIISYIFTGLILGNYFLKFPESKPLLEVFSDLGIAFLLFIVGLELKLKHLREIGFQSLIIGGLQEITTILAGFLIAKLIGFSTLSAFYLGLALSFSSTVIMVKLISDKGDLQKFYARLAIGFLLVQDLITILILFLIPFFQKEFFAGENIFNLILGILALIFIPLFSYRFLPKIENFLIKSQEILFLFSLAFGFLIATLFKHLGFGLESGALVAGISLSNLTSSTEIASRFKPLRDFFLVLFFILIGSKIFISNFDVYLKPALILSLFVLIGNPLLMLIILKPLGYTSKTSFLLGLTSAQISEFSFILINLGIKLGHLNEQVLSLTAFIGLITIFVSSYLFVYADKIYSLLERYLKIFERKKTKEEKEEIEIYDVILFGCDRTGFSFLNVLKNLNKKFLIIDYNPEKVKELKKSGFEVIYGDASEFDFLESLNLRPVKLVISTIPDFETNLLILKTYKKENPSGIFIGTSHQIQDALELYQLGSDYVIFPYLLGGEYASSIIEKYGFNKEEYQKLKEKHIKHLEKRKDFGH